MITTLGLITLTIICATTIIISTTNGAIHRWKANRTVTHYQLKTAGKFDNTIATGSTSGNSIAAMLTGEHFFTPSGGMSITRIGSKTRAPECYTQLPQRTQEATKGFGIKNYLREQNTELAAQYAQELNLGDPNGKWSTEDIITLKDCTSLTLIRAHSKQYPTIPITWPYPNTTEPYQPPTQPT